MMGEYLEIFKLHQDKVDRKLLNKMLEDMKSLKFNKDLERYNKKYINKPNVIEFCDKERYEPFIQRCNLLELKAILFDVSEQLISNKSIKISEYINFYIFALSMLERKEESFYLLCMARAYEWVQGVISQGNRIVEKNKIFNSIINDDNLDEKKSLKVDNCPIGIEEHFFVIALGKSIDFIKRMQNIRNKVIKDVTENVLKLIDIKIGLEKINNLRNMREHDDEYIEGKGNNPTAFIETSEDGFFQADATSTINIFNDNEGDKFYLGEKIEVNAVIEVYNTILSIIQLEQKMISMIDIINNSEISLEDKSKIQKVVNEFESILIEFSNLNFEK